jgi:hypothetical protein
LPKQAKTVYINLIITSVKKNHHGLAIVHTTVFTLETDKYIVLSEINAWRLDILNGGEGKANKYIVLN